MGGMKKDELMDTSETEEDVHKEAERTETEYLKKVIINSIKRSDDKMENLSKRTEKQMESYSKRTIDEITWRKFSMAEETSKTKTLQQRTRRPEPW